MNNADYCVTSDGLRLHYRIEGRADAPWLLLSNSLGTNLGMWQPQMPALLPHFRVVRYDTRGHGLSDVPSGPCKIADLGGDVLALLDFLGIAETRFCGLSLGGMTGMWLAVNHPRRIARLTLCNTAPRIAPPELWDARIAQVNAGGMQSIAANAINRWLTQDFQARAQNEVARVRQMLLDTAPGGYAACCAAIRDMDQRDQIASITLPTLVIAGTHDAATPPQDGKSIAECIDGARYVELDAAHLSNWEQTEAFNTCLVDFLIREPRMDDQERRDQGMLVRRAVLGDAYVQRAQDGLNSLNAEFQDLITRYAWGEIWTRPGLPRHMRSLLTIVMMVALNRNEELKLHLHAAANNGVSRDEIKEALLQTAIYCGVPAANSSFKLAEEVFAEIDSNAVTGDA